MNAHDLTNFIHAVELAKEGQKEEAYHQLKAILKTNDNHRDPNVLLWFGYSSPKLEESETAFATSAQIYPDNPALPAMLDWLAKEQRKRQQAEISAVVVPELNSMIELRPKPPRLRALAIACGVLAFLLLAALMVHRFAAPDGAMPLITAYVSDWIEYLPV
jgi:hypothetical protein